ncbi:unnamed protein product [Cylicostephanus goldi]|uniref:Uncharacterized protein n=1 Tax=Cylicostephanus goldi TaxID=71465 RepID=A0A3P6SDG2_CYLGO|nr:unnamed protein product [Cylicostephanus goldi]
MLSNTAHIGVVPKKYANFSEKKVVALDTTQSHLSLQESVYGDDYEDIGPAPFEPIGAESPTPVVTELQAPVEETQIRYMDEFSPLSEKKKRKLEGSRVAEEEEPVEGDEDHRWSKRTQNVLNTITGKLRSADDTQVTWKLIYVLLVVILVTISKLFNGS